MRGTLQKQKCGYKWMRIGFADTRFANTIRVISLLVMILLAIWAFKEIPNSKLKGVKMLAIYSFAAILYMNVGVWLHEQFHCLALRVAKSKNRTQIRFTRKYFLFLNGYYRVFGPMDYRLNKRALLAPLAISIALILVGILGVLFLPGWWLPVLLTTALAGLVDMTHDLYMYSKIRVIGEKGKYWDTGRFLEVVWKDKNSGITPRL